jgi:hypothetical protein
MKPNGELEHFHELFCIERTIQDAVSMELHQHGVMAYVAGADEEHPVGAIGIVASTTESGGHVRDKNGKQWKQNWMGSVSITIRKPRSDEDIDLYSLVGTLRVLLNENKIQAGTIFSPADPATIAFVRISGTRWPALAFQVWDEKSTSFEFGENFDSLTMVFDTMVHIPIDVINALVDTMV